MIAEGSLLAITLTYSTNSYHMQFRIAIEFIHKMQIIKLEASLRVASIHNRHDILVKVFFCKQSTTVIHEDNKEYAVVLGTQKFARRGRIILNHFFQNPIEIMLLRPNFV